MTDNEIIKALRCCHGQRIPDCDNCPNDKTCEEIDVLKNALDLINRQRAEIKRWEYVNKCDKQLINSLNKRYILAKSEAIKEFAEILKKRLCLNLGEHISVVTRDDIDNFVKEMTEEEE